MTTQLTIPTPFADLAELTENFAQRVDEQRLMLPNAEPITEGEWVQFDVQLADGTSALQGVGRVQGAFDNGEEHPPEYRFDVVLDSLQLDGMHEVMFERLLVARESQTGGEPVTGEVSVDELERHAAAEAAAQEAPAEPAGWDESEAAAAPSEPSEHASEGLEAEAAEPGTHEPAGMEPAGMEPAGMEPAGMEPGEMEPGEIEPGDIEPGTGEVDIADMEEQAVRAPVARAAAAKAPKIDYPVSAPREPGKLPSPHTFNGRALTRMSHPAVWSPEPSPRPDPAQSSGLFDYQGGVPRPAHPPRPELDPSQRIQPAPRPGAPWPRRGTGTHALAGAAVEPSVEAEAEAFEDLAESEPLVASEDEPSEDAGAEHPPAAETEREEW